MQFLWPTNLKAEPGGVARLGRVMHWFFVAIAVAFVSGGAYTWFTGYDDYARQSALAAIAFGGGGFFLAGRAVRYILSGE